MTEPPKDASAEETRSSVAGQVGRCRSRGDPEPHREAELEKRRDGATRGFAYRAAERMRESRQLEAPSPAQPEDNRIRGDPETARKAERDDAWSMQPASLPPLRRQGLRFLASSFLGDI